MTLPQTLLEVANDLATDAAAKADFTADPEGFLAERGLEGWGAEDLSTALEHVGDALPPDLASQLAPPGDEADPSEVFGSLVEVDPEPDPTALAFGTGELEAVDDHDERDEDTADGDEAPPAEAHNEDDDGEDEPGPDEPWTDALAEADDDEDDEDDDADDLELGFGAGAEDADEDLDE